jgi:hypothetical protein
LGFGAASAKAQVCKTLKLPRNDAKNQKDRSFFSFAEWLQYFLTARACISPEISLRIVSFCKTGKFKRFQ